MTGCSLEQVSRLLRELEDSGVFSRTEHGTIYSRRMVKDEATRRAKAAAGKLGGNPRLKGRVLKQEVNHGPNHGPNHEPKQKGGSSSSASSSSSISASKEKAPPYPPSGGEDRPDLFGMFWEAYPVKAKKPKAMARFQKLKPDRSLVDRMLEAICRQKRSRAWRKDGGQYIPHPATWLADRQWEDDPGPEEAGGTVWDEFIGDRGAEAS